MKANWRYITIKIIRTTTEERKYKFYIIIIFSSLIVTSSMKVTLEGILTLRRPEYSKAEPPIEMTDLQTYIHQIDIHTYTHHIIVGNARNYSPHSITRTIRITVRTYKQYMLSYTEFSEILFSRLKKVACHDDTNIIR